MTTVLIICTGNICRSPAAEALLKDRFAGIADITSAGTFALVGQGMADQMLDQLARDGIDGGAHVARQLDSELVTGADVVVTMTREHQARVMGVAPGALRTTVTLGELAAAARAGLALEGDDARARLATAPAAVQGGRHRFASSIPADIPDPYRRSDAAFRSCYRDIKDAVDHITEWVAA